MEMCERCLCFGSKPGFASTDTDLPWNICKSIPTTNQQRCVKGPKRCKNSKKSDINLETFKIPGFKEDFDISRNYPLEHNEHYIPSFSAIKNNTWIKVCNWEKKIKVINWPVCKAVGEFLPSLWILVVDSFPKLFHNKAISSWLGITRKVISNISRLYWHSFVPHLIRT